MMSDNWSLARLCRTADERAGAWLHDTDVLDIVKEIKEKDAEIAELRKRDAERLDLLIAKGEVISSYRRGIDDLIGALKPHSEDVEYRNIIEALESILKTAERRRSMNNV